MTFALSILVAGCNGHHSFNINHSICSYVCEGKEAGNEATDILQFYLSS